MPLGHRTLLSNYLQGLPDILRDRSVDFPHDSVILPDGRERNLPVHDPVGLCHFIDKIIFAPFFSFVTRLSLALPLFPLFPWYDLFTFRSYKNDLHSSFLLGHFLLGLPR